LSKIYLDIMARPDTVLAVTNVGVL
jgi:hypothetical protein